MFIVVIFILTSCTPQTQTQNTRIQISEQEAIEIAKWFESDNSLTWSAMLEENKEVEVNNEKKLLSVWSVSTTYPFGNKLIVTVDAINGDIISLTETEPENCCGEGLKITNEQEAIKIAKEIEPETGFSYSAVLDLNQELEINGQLKTLPVWTVTASQPSEIVRVLLIDAVSGNVLSIE